LDHKDLKTVELVVVPAMVVFLGYCIEKQEDGDELGHYAALLQRNGYSLIKLIKINY
jgi:hypothetical protein